LEPTEEQRAMARAIREDKEAAERERMRNGAKGCGVIVLVVFAIGLFASFCSSGHKNDSVNPTNSAEADKPDPPLLAQYKATRAEFSAAMVMCMDPNTDVGEAADQAQKQTITLHEFRDRIREIRQSCAEAATEARGVKAKNTISDPKLKEEMNSTLDECVRVLKRRSDALRDIESLDLWNMDGGATKLKDADADWSLCIKHLDYGQHEAGDPEVGA